jgi:glycosyltransferase involved in cell wall biosynthesis
MRRALHGTLSRSEFDAVHITGLPLATLAAEVRTVPSAMVVLDAWHLNAQAEVSTASMLRRPLKALEHRNTVRFERNSLRHFDRVVTVSETDATALTSLDPEIATSVIPNGVDAHFFTSAGREPERHLIVFIGTMSFAPNVEAARHMARDILPRVRAVVPEAKLAIVGRGMSASLADQLSSCAGVSVIGEVPDVRTWLNRAHVVVCPMVSGTGIKNKLLEAMAAGVPSVATSLACQGMTGLEDRQVLTADTPESFASCIVRIFQDDALAERLSTEGRAHVLRFHTWERMSERFEELYATIASARAGGARKSTPALVDGRL